MDPSIKVKVVEDYKNTGMVPGLGLDVAFSESAYTLPLNKISKPVRGSRTYFILQVTSRNIPDNNTMQGVLPAYTQGMLQQLKQSNYYGWFNKLREKAEIIDNRSKYFRDY
jgi:parvulin-like peptidyl-prolyl isomerase